MPDWHWAMSLNQAHAISTAVQYFRSISPLCTGSIVWQLNDCWPVVSWAAVDGDARVKPLLYALRHAHEPRLLTIQPTTDGLALAAVNDCDTSWTGTVQFRRLRFDGTLAAQADTPIALAARDTQHLMVPGELGGAEDPSTEVLMTTLGADRAFWFFTEPRDSQLPAARFNARLEPAADGYQLHITAQTLLRDLALLVDKLDPQAVVDDMLVTLLPGESVTFGITSKITLTLESICAPTVLRSANQLISSRLLT